jgi:hypothetical protein
MAEIWHGKEGWMDGKDRGGVGWVKTRWRCGCRRRAVFFGCYLVVDVFVGRGRKSRLG